MNNDNAIIKIPQKISDACDKVSNFFEMQGMKNWIFRGLSDARRYVPPYPNDPNPLDPPRGRIDLAHQIFNQNKEV